MRKFKVTQPRPNGLPAIEHTYKGFDKCFSPLPPYLACANVGGEIEIWAVDDPVECELVRYFENSHGEVNISIVYYKR